MTAHLHCLALACMLAATTAGAQATDTKDIVLDRLIAAPATVAPAQTAAPVAARTDAMAVSVLLESPDGTLRPRGTDKIFHTGDRFRVKVLASRDGKIALYNTNPKGVTSTQPIWRGDVKPGQETITPRLRLDGNSGVDHLHVALEPAAEPQGVFAWLSNWVRQINKEGVLVSKDIRLDVQNTDTATYLLNAGGQGLVATVRIVHR